jgi:hypothetical protein
MQASTSNSHSGYEDIESDFERRTENEPAVTYSSPLLSNQQNIESGHHIFGSLNQTSFCFNRKIQIANETYSDSSCWVNLLLNLNLL